MKKSLSVMVGALAVFGVLVQMQQQILGRVQGPVWI